MSSEIKKIVEALLFAAEAPLSLKQIMEVVESADREIIKTALEELESEYHFTDRAFQLTQVAGGYMLRTRPELAYWLRRLKRQQVTRLSRASLETLAIVAYRQPVLKAEIENIRGVEVGGILRTLMNKDLVRVVGRKDLPGRPLIYGTTKHFLEVFDLNSLEDLPTLEEITSLGGDTDMPLFEGLDPEALAAAREGQPGGEDQEADEDYREEDQAEPEEDIPPEPEPEDDIPEEPDPDPDPDSGPLAA